jgi:hypothetical protein
MPTRRARRAVANRDTHRRERKSFNRNLRIESKIRTLLERCPCSIINDKQLTEEECETLRGFVMTETRFDYYPVPKVLHNRIRKYVHDHPRIGAEGSLLSALIHRRFVTFNSPFSDQFRYSNLLDALMNMDYTQNVAVTYAPITPTFL